ncbi:hypothetical protein SK128_005814 [Halocaridina rubra]|uniref:Phorbol-ester/DAG-type domain-containing protein n=1 Tax=Halocaridina rubra TaxID=373956 RepID=A0AAN9AD49_HALRR
MTSTFGKKDKDKNRWEQKKKATGDAAGKPAPDSVVDNGVPGGRTRDVCNHCDAVVMNRGKNSDGLFCDYCNYWYHARCQGPIRQKVDENTKRIEKLEERADQQEAVIEKSVSDEVTRCLNDNTETKVQREWANIKDREVRARNVMFTGIVESRNGDKHVRKQEDIGKIEALLVNDLSIDLEQVKITNAIWIGKQTMKSEDNRPNSRLMKVMFENEKMASLVAISAKKLSESTDEDEKNVKIFS